MRIHLGFCSLLCLCFLPCLLCSQDHEALTFGTPDTGHIILQDGFALSYDGRLRSARWVAERLTKESLVKKEGVERQDRFRVDPRISVEFRANDKDYVGSKRDRGHLANSANHRSSQALNDDTFYFSNMSPQVGIGFNRHYWGRLEASVRNLANDDKVARVYVFTGPLFMPDDAPERGEAPADNSESEFTVTYRFIGANHVPEPTHYFKSVLAVRDDKDGSGVKRYRLWSYILPNKAIDAATPIDDFAVTTDFLEHWAGFDLWSGVAEDIEAEMEAKKIAPWEALPTTSN